MKLRISNFCVILVKNNRENMIQEASQQKAQTQALIDAIQGNESLDEIKGLIPNEDTQNVVNGSNQYGMTPLMLAAEKGYDNVVTLLLAHEANVNAQDNYNWTALMVAAAKGHDNVVKVLLERGADVHAKNKSGKTALMVAAEDGKLDVVTLLLVHKANVNAQDNDNWTALMIAAWNGHDKVVNALLERGADVNAKNKSGKTALDYANEGKYTAIVKLLQPYKVKADLTYKHSDEYVLSQLKAIDSEFAKQVQDANSKLGDDKEQFKASLLEALTGDPFAIYRLYNITAHTKNEVNLDTNMTDSTSNDLEDLIHQALQSEYNKLSSIKTFFYAILHFLAEYVIFPIWGDHEGTLAMGHGTDIAPSELQ